MGSFSLSWTRFAFAAVIILAVPAFFLYVEYRSGQLNAMYLSLPILFLSILTFFGFRWFKMRDDFANGRFTEADFRSNPLPIFIGRPVHGISWFLITFVLVFVPIAWWVFYHWPKA